MYNELMNGFSAEIELTNKCNKKCDFCYVERSEHATLDLNTIISFIDKISCSKLFKKHVTLFGGEPTLCMDTISALVNKKSDLSFTLITNGYVFNKKYIVDSYRDTLNKLSNIVCSIELTNEGLQKLRCTNEDVLSIIDSLTKSIDDINKISLNVTINVFMMKNFEEFIRNVEYLRNIGIKVNYMHIRGDSKFANIEEYKEFLKMVELYDIRLLKEMIHFDESRTLVYEPKSYMCNLNSKIGLKSNGCITPCTFLNSDYPLIDASLINNIHIDDISLDEILALYSIYFESIKMDNFDLCLDCEVGTLNCENICPAYFNEFMQNRISYEVFSLECEIHRYDHKIKERLHDSIENK